MSDYGAKLAPSAVVGQELGTTLVSGEARPFRMLAPHIDPAAVGRHLDPAYLTGRDEAQQVAVEPGVAHRAVVADGPDADLACS